MQGVCQTAGWTGILGDIGIAALDLIHKHMVQIGLSAQLPGRHPQSSPLSILPLPPPAPAWRHGRCQIGSTRDEGVLPMWSALNFVRVCLCGYFPQGIQEQPDSSIQEETDPHVTHHVRNCRLRSFPTRNCPPRLNRCARGRCHRRVRHAGVRSGCQGTQ